MLLFLKLAWRNLFRNRRRTVISGAAIGIGLAALIFVDAMILGMRTNMIHSATASFMGEAQIHGPQYRETLEVEHTIIDLPQVIELLDNDSLVAHFTPRLMSFSMISSPANVVAGSMIGVAPETERALSHFDEALIGGEYFVSDSRYDLLIGTKMAELLEVELGDRVVMTIAKAESGELSQEMFRVSGIFHFNTEEIDRSMAIVRLPVAQAMLGLEGQAHQLALDLVVHQDDPGPGFWQRLEATGNEALGWRELMPQLSGALEMSNFSSLIVGLVLFSLVALGIINTLFMSLYERMFEFGVLRAVGTRPFELGRLVVFEAAALAAVSIGLGLILGLIVTYIFISTGIDYTGIEFAGVTFREALYPEMAWHQFVLFPIYVFLFTILVGTYPALYAARMNAAEAMRRSF